MDFIQYLAFFGLIFFSVVKNITMKTCSVNYPPNHTALFFSFWLFVVNLFLMPLYYNNLFIDIKDNLIYFSFALLKGIGLYLYLIVAQNLNRTTGTSRAIVPVIAIGLIAFVNFFFFQEDLTNNQFISAILISIFGLIYYFKGHLNETSSHKYFIQLLICAIFLSIFDHLALSNIHWYSYLFVNTFVMLGLSFTFNKEIKEYNFLFKEKALLLSTAAYIGFEILTTSVRVAILPVTMANIAGLMSTPIIMLCMYFIWKESNVKKQLFFGIGSFLICSIALF